MRSNCCHDCPSFGFPGNQQTVPRAGKEAVGEGQAATLCRRGDRVGMEPLGSGRGLGLLDCAEWGQRASGSPYRCAWEPWGLGWELGAGRHPSPGLNCGVTALW